MIARASRRVRATESEISDLRKRRNRKRRGHGGDAVCIRVMSQMRLSICRTACRCVRVNMRGSLRTREISSIGTRSKDSSRTLRGRLSKRGFLSSRQEKRPRLSTWDFGRGAARIFQGYPQDRMKILFLAGRYNGSSQLTG